MMHCRDGEESRKYLISCYEAYAAHHSDGYVPSTAASDVKHLRDSMANGSSFRCVAPAPAVHSNGCRLLLCNTDGAAACHLIACHLQAGWNSQGASRTRFALSPRHWTADGSHHAAMPQHLISSLTSFLHRFRQHSSKSLGTSPPEADIHENGYDEHADPADAAEASPSDSGHSGDIEAGKPLAL